MPCAGYSESLICAPLQKSTAVKITDTWQYLLLEAQDRIITMPLGFFDEIVCACHDKRNGSRLQHGHARVHVDETH